MTAYEIYTISAEDWDLVNDSNWEEDDDEKLLAITQYVKSNYESSIKRGDIIELESESGFRNQGLYMWNGVTALWYADADSSQYGGIHPDFEIADNNGYNTNTWADILGYNMNVWFSPEIRERIRFPEKPSDARGGRQYNCNLATDKYEKTFVVYYTYETDVLIRGEVWKFQYTYTHTCHDGESNKVDHKKVLDSLYTNLRENKCTFQPNDCETEFIIDVTDTVHGTVRAPDPKIMEAARIARLEYDLERQRESMAQIEKDLNIAKAAIQ
jgi:hypothetical protein